MPATTLIEEAELRDLFDIHKDVKAGRLRLAIASASRRMRTLVTAEAYADALLDDGAADPVRRDALDFAEGHLAMHFALLGLNTQIRPKGVVSTEKVEGNVTVSYLRPKEISELAQAYLDEADEILRPYALTDGVPDAGLVGVDILLGRTEASTCLM